MRLIYLLISYVVLGVLFPFFLVHPKLRRGTKRRLGFYPPERPWPEGEGPRIWLHGASAGDLIALMPMMQQIRERAEHATLIVSTMTNSGMTIAEGKIRGLVDGVTYVPYDFAGATKRAVAAIQPDLLVLEYTEIWPNLIHAAKSAGAQVVLTNGRFSERNVPRYKLLYALIGNPLRQLSLLLMREEREAERALSLGAPRDRVRVTGNTKFDNVARGPDEGKVEELSQVLGLGGEKIFVAGSTHDGEDKHILHAFRAMREVEPTLRMIIAPRYTERGAKVASIARGEGYSAVLRSQPQPNADVIVLDTIGELLAAYTLATLVFVGGSFVRRGGQNILEPAGQGRPVLFGPYMMNFRDSVEVLQGRGGIQVATPEQLASVASELLGRPDEIERLGEMALNAVQKARGASAANAEALLALAARGRKRSSG